MYKVKRPRISLKVNYRKIVDTLASLTPWYLMHLNPMLLCGCVGVYTLFFFFKRFVGILYDICMYVCIKYFSC